jgi:carbonic anhydrase/acetyltransferase-like protein (isoleucine patch superfamily)
MIRSFQGKAPRVPASAFVDLSAQVIGQVDLGEQSSVWCNVVIRGDVEAIHIGAQTNIQDLSCVHVFQGRFPTWIGDRVTVGHKVMVHGCTVEDDCLIGMGAILLDGCVIGRGSIIAAGALVPPGMVVPPGSMVMGAPGKVKRPLKDEEKLLIEFSALNYVEEAKLYIAEGTHQGR